MSEPSLHLLEPADPGLGWAPFTGARPIAELRAGLWLIRERWEAVLQRDTTSILGQHVVGFHEGAEPPVEAPHPIRGPAVVAASWFAPSGAPLDVPPGIRRLVHEGTTVAWLVQPGEEWDEPHEAGEAADIDGLVLHGAYDLLTALEHLLPPDCADFLTQGGEDIPDGSIVLGDPAEVIVMGAKVEPGVIFDVRHGAVVLDEGSEVRAGTRLEGPLYLGPRSIALGGDLRGSVFGPQCRLRGEIAASVFLGYGNKAHEGFVGHSVIGHWANLGAGTTTSNLKNTYGPVRLQLAEQRIDTGRQFVGSLIGDHAKTAIGTMLGTGTVVGTGANVFGPTVPRHVPAFAWGVTGIERVTEEGFLTIAGRVLPRRQVELTPARAESLRATWRRLAGP